MKNLDLKDKAQILNNELTRLGQKLGHVQTLNILAQTEGYKTYANYKEKQEQKNTQTIEIDKEIWDSFVSKREDFGIPVEIQLETLIEQEIYQTKEDVNLYTYEDRNFDTYLVFAKSKRDALSIIDGSYLPPSIYDIGSVKEVSLETFHGIMIQNTWKGIDIGDDRYNEYKSVLVDAEGGNTALFSETLMAYQNNLDAMELVDGQIVPDHHDEKILEWLKEEKQKDPEIYTRYMELHEIVLETDKIVKGE